MVAPKGKKNLQYGGNSPISTMRLSAAYASKPLEFRQELPVQLHQGHGEDALKRWEQVPKNETGQRVIQKESPVVRSMDPFRSMNLRGSS